MPRRCTQRQEARGSFITAAHSPKRVTVAATLHPTPGGQIQHQHLRTLAQEGDCCRDAASCTQHREARGSTSIACTLAQEGGCCRDARATRDEGQQAVNHPRGGTTQVLSALLSDVGHTRAVTGCLRRPPAVRRGSHLGCDYTRTGCLRPPCCKTWVTLGL